MPRMASFTLNTTQTPHALYILLALHGRQLRGVSIISQVAHDSASDVIMASGTTYPLLKRLSDEGLIETLGPTLTNPYHYYQLTSKGQDTLESEIKRLSLFVFRAKQKLGHRVI
jgi:DNA-binding PadR family transcriptional regulator